MRCTVCTHAPCGTTNSKEGTFTGWAGAGGSFTIDAPSIRPNGYTIHAAGSRTCAGCVSSITCKDAWGARCEAGRTCSSDMCNLHCWPSRTCCWGGGGDSGVTHTSHLAPSMRGVTITCWMCASCCTTINAPSVRPHRHTVHAARSRTGARCVASITREDAWGASHES